jgi:hypothetical protein
MLAVLADQHRREENEEEEEEEDWDEIAKAVPGKTPVNCLRRYMGHLNKKEEKAGGASPPAAAAAKRGPPDEEDEESFASPLTKKAKLIVGGEDGDWTQEEVDLLKKLVEQYQESEYILYPSESILTAFINCLLLPLRLFTNSFSSLERHCRQLSRSNPYRMPLQVAKSLKSARHQRKGLLDHRGRQHSPREAPTLWEKVGKDCCASARSTRQAVSRTLCQPPRLAVKEGRMD